MRPHLLSVFVCFLVISGALGVSTTPVVGADSEAASPNSDRVTEVPEKEYGPHAGAMHMKGHYAKLGLLDAEKASDFERFEVVDEIVRDPTNVPEPIARERPTKVHVELVAKEVISEIDEGIFYNYWTYNGKVPGPMIRVREGDTVVLTLKSAAENSHNHSIDLHAVTGPAGGGVLTRVGPGESQTMRFKALQPGFYVYHCSATPKGTVPVHIANQMFGGILVEPKEGLAPVDKEFMVFQGELYTDGKMGEKGFQPFDPAKMLNENPTYFTVNGRPAGLTGEHALEAETGDRVRVFYANMGNSRVSSFHIIGETLDRVYRGASRSPSGKAMETVTVAAGQGIMVELSLEVPGRYTLVDHALSRITRGAWAALHVEGEPTEEIYSKASP